MHEATVKRFVGRFIGHSCDCPSGMVVRILRYANQGAIASQTVALPRVSPNRMR